MFNKKKLNEVHKLADDLGEKLSYLEKLIYAYKDISKRRNEQFMKKINPAGKEN